MVVLHWGATLQKSTVVELWIFGGLVSKSLTAKIPNVGTVIEKLEH
jgi:hypothetical protein